MKHFAKTLLAGSFCILTAVPAYAGHGHDSSRLWDRLERQHYRIDQGVESGELTRKEAKVLRKQHRKIRRLAREFREDGGLSRKEQRILKRKLEKAGDRIWALKHNDQYRYANRFDRYEDRWSWDGDSTYWQRDSGNWLYFGYTDW